MLSFRHPNSPPTRQKLRSTGSKLKVETVNDTLELVPESERHGVRRTDILPLFVS